jgi:hypothetical protein
MEHRWGCRTSTDIAVRLVASPVTVGTGRMLNVSVTGAFVQTSLYLPLLTLVHLEPLASAAGSHSLERIVACVVRHGSIGVGLEWCNLETGAVDALLSAVRGRAPVKPQESLHMLR